MILDEIRSLLDDYVKWLRDNTAASRLDGTDSWIRISTPYLDRHNDRLQIYARKKNGQYELSDDGYTIDDLKMSGCELDTPKRRELLNEVLNGFGVKSDNGQLMVITSSSSFSKKKHSLVQAMLAINDLFCLSSQSVCELFLEDVSKWLDLNEVRYTPSVKFTGKSGLDHLFEFVIPRSARKPERILRAINRPTRNSAESLVFAWLDTRQVRPSGSQAYAMLNDRLKSVSRSVVDALTSYEIHPILWSKRDEYREELSA